MQVFVTAAPVDGPEVVLECRIEVLDATVLRDNADPVGQCIQDAGELFSFLAQLVCPLLHSGLELLV